MGTLVCGVQDSPEAVEALRVARLLSLETGLRLVLVYVEDIGPGSSFRADARERGRRRLDRVLAKQAVRHAVDTRVEVGPAAEELARVASEEAATLIIVGSPSRHCWRHPLRSTLTAELAATADCPVVVVPPAPAR